MPFENEFASYEPLRRILNSDEVKAMQDRFKIREVNEDTEKSLLEDLIDKHKLQPSLWQPDMIVGIDGSFHAVPAQTGFPGAEFGYVTVASVLLLLKEMRMLEKEEFINPQKFRETEKAATIDAVFPGCNVVINGEDSAKSSMRKALYEKMKYKIIFSEGETLLDTYEALLKMRIDSGVGKIPDCPHDGCDAKLKFDFGEYECPSCHGKLYSTDALRLYELFNPVGTCGEMYGQIMSALERLWLIHILRAFEKKNWLPTLLRMAFMVDGLLAVSSVSAWLSKPISQEIRRINTLQKKITGQDLLIIGIEKTGTFVNHFEALDTTKTGSKGNFPLQTALLLDDEYIKQNIVFSKSATNKDFYGSDTYFGRKFFYKTNLGYRVVASIAFLNDYHKNLSTAHPNQFPRLADVMNLLDQIVSSRYPNAVMPLVSAHAEAAIPLNLGKRIFEEIAREIRDKS